MDGTSSGLIFCEDTKVVDQWVHYITNSIVRLNSKSIKLSNKFLHPDELVPNNCRYDEVYFPTSYCILQIVYLGWVCEKLKDADTKEYWQSWEPRFLILKGSEVCVFEAPPVTIRQKKLYFHDFCWKFLFQLNAEDLNKCIVNYRIFETRFKDIKVQYIYSIN